MKRAREDYNRIQDPENKIPNGEPVFLIMLICPDCEMESLMFNSHSCLFECLNKGCEHKFGLIRV